jgi:hypothetical protein
VPVFHLMRTYNRRIAAIARERRRRGVWGRANHGERFLFPGFSIGRQDSGKIMKALLQWLRLELTEGWRSWGRGSCTAPPLVKVTAREQMTVAQ